MRDLTEFKITDHIDDILRYVYENRNTENTVVFYRNSYKTEMLSISYDQLSQCHQFMISDHLIEYNPTDKHSLKFELSSKAIKCIEKP